MRNAIAVALLGSILCLGICLKAKDANPNRDDIEQAFDKIIAARDSRAGSQEMRHIAKEIINSRDENNPWSFLGRSEPPLIKTPFPESATLALKKQIFGKGVDRKIAIDYRNTLLAELNSPNAMYRGLACEFLGLGFDTESVTALAGLLEDRASSVLQFGYAEGGPLIGSPVDWYCLRPTVRLIANNSLSRLTGLGFTSTSQFHEWWITNNDYSRHIWYWSMLWTCEDLISSRGCGDPDSCQAWDNHQDEFIKLDGETKLKVILLYNYFPFVQSESALSMGLDPAKYDSRIPGVDRPSSYSRDFPDNSFKKEVVSANDLKFRLIELLDQKNLYPEIRTEYEFRVLTSAIANIDVFNHEDEKILAAAQKRTKPFKAYAEPFVRIRCRIAPQQCQSLREESLREKPAPD